jgi:hypothetical protein
MQHTAQATQAAIQAAMRKALHSMYPAVANVYGDEETGVGITATVQVCTQAIVQTVEALGATAVQWGGLHTATGSEDSEVTFTYNEQQCYIVTCYDNSL